MLRKWFGWLNIWDEDDDLHDQLVAEFGAHALLHALVPLLGFFLLGDRGFWAGMGASWVYALYKEFIQDGHAYRIFKGVEGEADLHDFYTDLFSRTFPLVLLLLLYMGVK